jgi:TorA maturation chaperone TorD
MHEERALNRSRLRLVDLLKSFFLAEPDAEILARWRGMISALMSENITPAFDQAVRDLHQALARASRQEIAGEFYALFTDPFSPDLALTTASAFLDGHGFGPTLVRYRDFLGRAGIALAEEIRDPDDSLVLMLDALATLIEAEKNGESSQELQSELVHQFLAPVSARFRNHLEQNEQARFYRLCARLLHAYMDMEKELLPRPDMNKKNMEHRP